MDDSEFTVITGPRDKLTDSKSIAYGLIVSLKMDIARLPRFNGQAQVVRALSKVLALALWKKG